MALMIPLLVGYVIYDQARVPVAAVILDWQSGVVQEVYPDTLADWNGFQVGDIVQRIEGVKFAEWEESDKGNYQAEVLRGDQLIQLELPVVSIVTINPWPLISAVTIALTYWSLSLILLIRRFQHFEIRLLFLTVLALSITLLFPIAYSGFYMQQWALNLSVISLYLSAPLGLHYYLTFPIYLGSNQQRRILLSMAYGGAIISIIAWLMQLNFAIQFGILNTVLVYTTAMGLVIFAYFFRAAPDDRRKIRILLLGTILAGMPAILFYLVPTFLGSPYRLPIWLVGLFTIFAPVAYFYTIFRHNLFGMDRLLNRTLVYTILSGGTLVLYLGPFLWIYQFASGDIFAQAMVAAGLSLLVGLAFERTRDFVQKLVDRIFYGGWYDYPGVVETISNALSRCVQREQITDVLSNLVADLMQLHPGDVWIGGPNMTLPSKVSEPLIQFSFDLQGRFRGRWTVAPRRDGDAFSESDRRILTTLAHQAEVALNNVLLIETLQQPLAEIRNTQRQLLRSREEERARLARELHDGPIQSLVGLNIQLGLQLAGKSSGARYPSEDFDAAFNEMQAEVKNLLAELRGVCTQLRPPMLDTLGLGAAIRALVDDWIDHGDFQVQLTLPADTDLRFLPDEVAVNLYRVAQEALSNVARHAEAHKVVISLMRIAGRIRLCIQDDGQGFEPPAIPNKLATQGHFGLAGMQERIDLIGGRLELRSAPGEGTEVCVTWHPPDMTPMT